MTKVLITGATGNVGLEVIQSLGLTGHQMEIYAGVRDLKEGKGTFKNDRINLLPFDFTDLQTFKPALEVCDILFLLRPPHIAEVEKYFKPLIEMAVQCNIQHIVFLSVQGVENSRIIPHHKIEKLIVESKIPYTFLRPAYFMQNFTSTLRNDLVNKKRIFLPAGNARFTIIDVRDIGLVAASILADTSGHINKAYDLTCNEKLTFGEMAQRLSTGLGIDIHYESPSLLNFYLVKRREKTPFMFILVMIMLHYFPRFQKEPEISDWTEQIIGRQATRFDVFVSDYKNLLR